jgi:hypothetical protein
MGVNYLGHGKIPTMTDTSMLSMMNATNLSPQDARTSSIVRVGVPQVGQYSASCSSSFPHFLQYGTFLITYLGLIIP